MEGEFDCETQADGRDPGAIFLAIPEQIEKLRIIVEKIHKDKDVENIMRSATSHR